MTTRVYVNEGFVDSVFPKRDEGRGEDERNFWQFNSLLSETVASCSLKSFVGDTLTIHSSDISKGDGLDEFTNKVEQF